MTAFRFFGAFFAAFLLSARADEAHAHAFQSGSGYDNFLEGAYVVLAYPDILLPVVAVGILVGLWHPNGTLKALPAFAAGLIVGFPLSALATPIVAIWMMGLGALTAVVGALASRHTAAATLALSFLTGLLAMMVSLEGHALFELSALIYAGIFLTACFALLVTANGTRMALDQFPVAITSIAFRVAESWVAAALLLFLAFALRG